MLTACAHAPASIIDIYDAADMSSTSSTSNLRIPALCVRVTCMPSSPLGPAQPGAQPGAGPGALPGLSSPLLMMQGLAAVPLPPDTVLLSAAHPVADAACFASAQEDGVWSLPAREVALERSSAHPLALVVPGLRLQLQCAGVPGSDRTAFSHLLSCSVPLGACFKDLLTRNMYTLQRSTCEDGMTYLVQLAVDTRRLSASDVQQTATEMQAGLDVLLHHQSAMAAALGTPLKTVDELVAEVCELKDQRARATASVLAALSAGEQSNSMLDLQYGRAFGMRVDQQQCRALREGAVLGNSFEQTLLHASIAQASLVAKIAQEAGVSGALALNPEPKSEPKLAQAGQQYMHTANALGPFSSPVHTAVQNFVRTNGAAALMHSFTEQAQTAYCSRTSYQYDPSFAPSMNVARATQNDDGSMTLTVLPQLALQATPGEDQNLTPGVHMADVLGFERTDGLMRRDCEDGAHAIAACADLFRCVPPQQLLAAQQQVLHLLPADVQAVGPTLLYMSSVLQEHAAQVDALHAAAPQVWPVTADTLVKLAGAKPASTPVLFATSLLASAPQLSASLGGTSADPCSKLDCSAKEYNAWWTGALMSGEQSGLTGHSVAVSMGLAPLCSTTAEGARVDVHLLDSALRVYESTSLARQIQAADTAAVKLQVDRAPVTPVRQNLQQKLNQCGPLTMCMACNLRSTLHAEETKRSLAQAQQVEMLLTGGAASGGQAPRTPSIVPMQTFTLRAEATTAQELSRQMSFTFYKTMLSCGRGLVYTLDRANGGAYAGMPMSRALPNSLPLVVGAPLGAVETRNLRVLGALQATFVLGAAEALAHLPPVMPLALQQRMKLSALHQQLAPLSTAELRGATHGCGMLAQTPVFDVRGAGGADLQATLQNMHAVQAAAQQIVGADLDVTGGAYADTVMITFS